MSEEKKTKKEDEGIVQKESRASVYRLISYAGRRAMSGTRQETQWKTFYEAIFSEKSTELSFTFLSS